MKRSDSGDFCVLYVEPDDEKASLFQEILEQKKPIVIMLADQARVFQRPEDFAELKHIRRRLDVPILFVTAGSERLVHLAGRNGFPVYLSMDALVNALKQGQAGRQRGVVRKTIPLGSGQHDPLPAKKATATLNPPSTRSAEASAPKKTVPLLYETWGGYETDGRGDGQQRPEGFLYSAAATGARKDARNYPSNAATLTERQERQTDTPVRAQLLNPPAPTRMSGPLYPPGGQFPQQAFNSVQTPAGSLPRPANAFPPRSGISQTNIPTVPTMPLVAAPPPVRKRPRVNRVAASVLVLLLIALVTAGLGYFMIASHGLLTDAPPAVTNVVLGHVTFVSSNQLSESSSQGLTDQIVVDLNSLPQPAAGKSYYAWLLEDKNQGDMKTLLLGTLPVSNGHAQLSYPGDVNHTNLLETNSRFLVTEEDAATLPLTPSPDYNTWRYYGEISQAPINAPDNTQHFSYLDHLRHLLASDPTLDELELPGGLDTWLYRNVNKIQEWTGSMRDQWQESKDIGLVRRQTLRTLTYLDGVSFVARDLPPNTGLNVNERLARIGLLDIEGPMQDPAGYLSHISKHLYGLLEAKTATPALHAKVTAIVEALNNVKAWLIRVHHDGLQIMNMSDQQLRQPGTLTVLNDMIFNATSAFTGYADPASGQMHQGVTWIHGQIQSLAMLDVKSITAADARTLIGPVQMVPNNNIRRASTIGGIYE